MLKMEPMHRRRASFKIDVNPGLIAWAISSSGWKIDELSQRLGIEASVAKSWMSGKANPSLRQLEALSKLLRRPLAVFFLSEPPKERPLPKDYRVSPEKRGEFDRETLLAVRKARRLQRASRELLENQNGRLEPKVKLVSITDDPRGCASTYRKEFAITDALQREWHDSYEAFNVLRGLVEDRNVFVFQMRMPMNDARGFVLVDDVPSVIVVNSSDQIEARIFTLVHEFGHVLLNKTGINTPEMGLGRARLDEVEKWCNGFAAEFLVPKVQAEREFGRYEDTLLEDETIRRLSRRFKVSKTMLLVRMKDLGIIEHGEFDSALSDLRSRGLPKQEEGFGETVERRVLRERGRKFVSLVAQNVEQGSLDYANAIDFLSIKLRDVDKVMAKASQ
jgi:Zn-dependent peptidase ImmA (M78 family)